MMFTHKAVQDLAFIIKSEPIYQDINLSQYWYSDTSEKLKALDENVEPLLTFLAKSTSHFLGTYFESLFSYAIKHLSTLHIIFEHQQVHSVKKTIGEIDMLVSTPQGQVYQFEIAVKFYLEKTTPNAMTAKNSAVTSKNSTATITNWLGPNKNDSFQKKYRKAKDHQLTILDSLEGKQLLQEHDIKASVSRHLLMFGFLYLHLNTPLINTKRSELVVGKHLGSVINSNSIQGYWLYIDDLDLLNKGFIQAQELQKLEWLSGIKESIHVEKQEDTKDNGKDHEGKANIRQKSTLFTDLKSLKHDVKQAFLLDERPRHFMMTVQTNPHSLQLQRIFIVPNNW